MDFSRQEYWSGLLFPSPGDLPDPGIEPVSPSIGGWTLYHCTTWDAPSWVSSVTLVILLGLSFLICKMVSVTPRQSLFCRVYTEFKVKFFEV